jgi:hypothetical protein
MNIRRTKMFNKILVSVLMMCATPAFGLMLNFDGVPGEESRHLEGAGVFTESGFTTEGFSYMTTGAIHLDDTGPYRHNAIISGSKRFDALSLSLLGYEYSSWYEIFDPTTGEYLSGIHPVWGFPMQVTEHFVHPNVLVQGVRDSSIVAEARFSAAPGAANYTLSPDFNRLDSLIVTAASPDDPGLASFFLEAEASLALLYPGMVFQRDCDWSPCSHFEFDGLEVHATPLPGGLVLMLSAVIGGGITRRLMAKKRTT